MDYNDVLKIRETQRSEQERYDIQTQLAQSNIEKLLSTEAAKQITVPKLTEIESLLFKLKSELFSYISEKGLIDGLIWNGALQPVSDRKIVITKDMIKAVTDSIYTKQLAKLAGIEEGAEVNKVIDVIFNDVSVVDENTRVATITITPEDIKQWYESNENTNCYTDAEKELVATIPSLTEDVQNIEEEQTKQNERLDSLEQSQEEQDERLDTIEAEQVEQNNRLDTLEPKVEKNIEDIANIKLEQTEQNNRLTTIEAEQVVQNNRLDAIETEQDIQDANIELNKTNIELNKTNLEQEIKDRTHADEDIQAKYDAEIKRIDEVNEHLQHEVDTKVKDVLLDGISVCDENRNAKLDSEKIAKILDVKVDGESVVNSDKIADIDTSEICKVKDVEVDGTSVVENHIAKIDTTEFCKVKDVTVDGESVVNAETKVAEIDLSNKKIDHATQINIDDSVSDILVEDETTGDRDIVVDGRALGVLEDVTLDGESVIRYSNAEGGRSAIINSKVKDVQLDGKSIVDSDKIANIDTSTFGKVDDVKIDGESVVTDKVANIDLKPYENDITDVTLDGVSIVEDKVAKLTSTSFGEIKDIELNGVTIVDPTTKIGKLDTVDFGGIDLISLNDKAIRGVNVDGALQPVDETSKIVEIDTAKRGLGKVTNVTVDGDSVLRNGIAEIESENINKVIDVTVNDTSILDTETKIAKINTEDFGGINLNGLDNVVAKHNEDIASLSKQCEDLKDSVKTNTTNIATNTNDIEALSKNYEELAVDVNNNTNDISSNTTRISSLEQLQSVVPSSKNEADVMVLTALNSVVATGISTSHASAIVGYIPSTKTMNCGATPVSFVSEYNFLSEGEKNILFRTSGVVGGDMFVGEVASHPIGYYTTTFKTYGSGVIRYSKDILKYLISSDKIYFDSAALISAQTSSAYIWPMESRFYNLAVTTDTDIQLKVEYYKFLPASETVANSLTSDGIATADETYEEVNNVEYITIPTVPDGFYEEYRKNLINDGMTEEEADKEVEAQKARQAEAEAKAKAEKG